MCGACDFAIADSCLHPDNHYTAFGCTIALLVLGVAKVALFLPLALGQWQFKLRTISPPPFFFTAPDFVDDPGL
jgi:hypothetical protein